MNIGAAAAASGVSAKMIRYYEQQGLLMPAKRTAAGYRQYGDEDVHTLRFIKRARDLGFAVEWIKDLLALWQNPDRHSRDVRVLASEHLRELQHKIAQLQQMAATLQNAIDCCAGDNSPDCPILQELEQEHSCCSSSNH